ncbi:unnamed protein product [Clonostachys solani]|uniref:non-specific serine/threonine protein kinase n=1 Tax=Clonostachys solani TaxID=160281 RepID=A0A9N9Z4S2_9HYPO|nr:unnamed protein product [Clonostachys solani]
MKRFIPGFTTGGDEKGEVQKRTPNKLLKKRPPAAAVAVATGSSTQEAEKRAPRKLQKKRPATDLHRFKLMLDSVTPNENSENSLEKFHEVAKVMREFSASDGSSSRSGARRGFMISYIVDEKLSEPARWMTYFKTLQLIDFLLHADPSAFISTVELIVDAASQFAEVFTDSYQQIRVGNGRGSLLIYLDRARRRTGGESHGFGTDWPKRVLERPDPRQTAVESSSLGSASPGNNDQGTQRSGNKEPARWPVGTTDIEEEFPQQIQQIQEEGLLKGLDLDNIDLNRDTELSSTITEAYRRRQSGRAQNESEKEPLPNEAPESKKITEQSTRSGKVVSDLVRDSKLETIIASNGSVVRHISYVSNPRMRQRRMKKEETWRRRKKLGSGSFGCVWLEERLDGDDTGRLRAVKEITKNREGKRSEIDYNRELEAIAKFSHSKSFGWYESQNTIFITMEHIEKGDLQSYLVRPFPEEEVKQIAFQLLEGLGYMHENGFAHRDLKPANILVSEPSPNWWVKISDFGISKRAEEEATAYRTFVGTRGYLAPEILGIYSTADMDSISSSQTLDDSYNLYTVSVDLWALGAIIYRLLTNEILFGDPRDLAKYVTAGHPFPRATALELGANEACVEFLENIMARSPNSRPSSSEALRHPWLSELQELVDTTSNALEELSIAVEDSQTEHTIVDTSVASAQWPTSLG